MPPGKMASQAGHAFLDSIKNCQQIDPERGELYYSDGHGTKIVLSASEEDLIRLHQQAKDAGLPTALIIDSGHVMLPHFTGEPIITAVGIGPVYRHESTFLKRYPLVR